MIEEEELHSIHIDTSKWLDFHVFSDISHKEIKVVGTSDPLSIGQ